MHTHFIEYATALSNEYLLKTEYLFSAHKDQWIEAFAKHFQSVCKEIVRLQAETSLSAISYIEYTMLYMNFTNRRYVSEVCIYEDKSFCDRNHRIISEYDISYMFVYFDELWNKLLSQRKRYVSMVSAQEVKSVMIDILPRFYKFLVSTARFAIAECAKQNFVFDIVKNSEFAINVGEYMSKTETVYLEKKNKNARELTEWIGEHLIGDYVYGDYSGLDFSGCSFKFTELRYSSFYRSSLNNASLEGSVIIGTNFNQALMEHCSLDHCHINEANFSCAVLKNASFINAQGQAGLTNENEWWHVGFLPVGFRHADLSYVNFTDANLAGADFTGANLTGAIFINTNLTGAIFTDVVLDGTIFTNSILDDTIL